MRQTCGQPTSRHGAGPTSRLPFTVLCAALIASILLSTAGADLAFAQSEWNPFQEQDERARRQRRGPQELPPPLAPADRDPANAGGGTPPFGVPYPGASGAPPPFASGPNPPGARNSTVEKIELAPIDPVPAAAGPPPASPTGPIAGPSVAVSPAPPAGGWQPAPGVVPAGPRPMPAAPAGVAPSQWSAPLWQGVDMAQLEALITPLAIPPRSPALHALWVKLLTDQGPPPTGGKGPSHFAALQMEGLYRSGLIDPLSRKLGADTSEGDPLAIGFRIRRDLASGDRAGACGGAKALAAKRQGLPKLLAGEVHLLNGYCAAADGNYAAAGLAAELAREEDVQAGTALQALDALAMLQPGAKPAKPPKIALPERLLVLDYRLLTLLGAQDPQTVLEKAEPALLYALAAEGKGEPRLTVLAAESAARMNAISPAQLGETYRQLAVTANLESDALFRRASLFKAIVAEPGPPRRMALIRQLLDDARKSGLYLVAAQVAATKLGDIDPAGMPGPLVETAAEVAVAGGDYARARQLASINPAATHWAALADIVDPRNVAPGEFERALSVLESLARANRIPADVLHRLATVLDALDVNVPIPLWEAASRTPQPNTGHLPDTGTLPDLQAAAKKREIGRTVLLVMKTLGNGGPDTAHLISLGDSIRALRRVGLDAEARRIGLEALFAGWPRGVVQ